MKQQFLIFTIIIFSIISGIIGSFGVFYLLVSPNSSLQEQIRSITYTANPSVVSIIQKKDIAIYKNDPWNFFKQSSGNFNKVISGGSGFFIDKNGTILTNKHVVSDNNSEYRIILADGREYNGEVIFLDPKTDLAFLKIQAISGELFPPLLFIQDTQKVLVGDFVLAIGNALGKFQNSVSFGIISGKNREIELNGYTLSNLIQSDAAIHPGSSGGPLINLDGKVIGINTAIATGNNSLSLAISLSQEYLDSRLLMNKK